MPDTPTSTDAPDAPAPRPWWVRFARGWLLPLAGAAVVFVLMGWLRAPRLPDQAPDFTLPSLDGTPITLSELQGTPVVLNFWATWCAPCRAEVPTFAAFARRHPNITVLGVAADGPAAKVARVARDLGADYPMVLADRETLAKYGVSAYPTTVILDANGHVLGAHAGLMLGPQLWWATRHIR